MRLFDLIDMFGQTLDKVTIQDLSNAHVLYEDTLDNLLQMNVGQTMDLAGYEGAMLVRRVN